MRFVRPAAATGWLSSIVFAFASCLVILASAVVANATEISATPASISAQSRSAATSPAKTAPRASYGFIDFIAREDPPTGHAYVRYGRYDKSGRPVGLRYAGLYPRYGWAGKIAGGFIPVDSETGRHAEDTDSRTLVSFRRPLTRQEYETIDAQVRKTQAEPAYWHAVFFNCNEYVGTLARSIGMHAGLSSWLPSPAYVESMKALNGY